MTSVPDGQNQDYRRLLALRTSGATPPPSERFLPIAPAPPPANVQSQQPPQPSAASAQQQAASTGLINSVGDPYMRREAPPPSSSYHYRLPPHVAAAYQAQVRACHTLKYKLFYYPTIPYINLQSVCVLYKNPLI